MMGRWKIIFILILITALTVFMFGCGGTSKQDNSSQGNNSQSEQVKLRLAHVVQESHPVHIVTQQFVKLVEERSNGRIKITIYPARQLGDDRQLIEQLQNGTLDMGVISAAPMGGFTPIATALQLPWLIDSYDTWLKVMTSEAATELLDGLSEIDVKGLAIFEGGQRHFVSTSKFIKTPDDFKSFKIRVAETPLLIDMFKSLGAAPTPMPYGEIYSGLQNKVIDGLEMDISAMLVEKHYEVAKYVTHSRHYTWPMPLMMSVQRWNSLAKEDQELIQKAAWDVLSYNIDLLKQMDEDSLAQLKQKGVNFFEPTDLTPFLEATKTVYDKYTSQHPLVVEFVKYAQEVKGK